MAASPTSIAVVVTLTPTNDQCDTRTILIRPGTPLIIGRSSRSEPKNLIRGTHNALFENPVISRKHAQLTLSASSPGAVNIMDLHSMHGTTVNGMKLSGTELRRLHTGDVVKLGDEVVRSHDKHDGLTLTIDIAGQPSIPGIPTYPKMTTNTSNSFTVPDGDDSDYDSDASEMERSYNNLTSSAQTTPEQGSEKIGSQQAPIDLDEPTGYGYSAADEPKDMNVVTESVQDKVIPDTYAWGEYDDVYAMSEDGSDVEDEEEESYHPDEENEDNGAASDDADSNMADSDVEDEAPEVLSSKREPSPELGSSSFDTAAPATESAAASKKPHYDPVRGYEVPQTTFKISRLPNFAEASSAAITSQYQSKPYASTQPAPSTNPYSATQTNNSRRWDAPARSSVDDAYFGHDTGVWGSGSAYQYTNPYYAASPYVYPQGAGYYDPQPVALPIVPAYRAVQPKTANKVDIMNLVEDRAAKIDERIAPTASTNLKRKASEISENVVAMPPAATAQTLESLKHASALSGLDIQTGLNEINITDLPSMADTNAIEPSAPRKKKASAIEDPFAGMSDPFAGMSDPFAGMSDVDWKKLLSEPIRPRPVKRMKMVKKVLLHAATAGSYMALGGALTVAFLASPAAESLLGAL
ncbi:hypothetical protein B0A48_08631 [Cryoendolithus antarcticus]|uniref:FHA domain-containing protein n=1 Tax=Cryoendolithus antarcticus TaxID=1507870 RepID=A0A1V8T3Q2_9PEZI|nr:hypothetical protein B0A48_08631 [Cryoendolithus antarcticus]